MRTELEKRSRRDFRLLDQWVIIAFSAVSAIALCGIIFDRAYHQAGTVLISLIMIAVSAYDFRKQGEEKSEEENFEYKEFEDEDFEINFKE
jgi:cbb3-type cytochrome oxidase subunit 3